MKRRIDDNPDEFLDLELQFSDNYEEMNKFIIFFEKVQEILALYPNVKVDEVVTSRISPETKKILPFTHKVLIKSKSYLIYVRNDSDPNLTEEELKEYKRLFSEDITQSGFIIVWNDENLSSIKLTSENLYDPSNFVLNIIKDERMPFEDLIKQELASKDKISESIKEKTDRKVLINLKNQEQNIISEFNEYLSKAFRNSINKPQLDLFEKSILNSIEDKDLEKICEIFSEYLANEIDSKDLQNEIIYLIKSLVIQND
ncbi:MAG: hypothetical protein ACFFDN_14160 [Candidatus Hodarchaeota archaeon]